MKRSSTLAGPRFGALRLAPYRRYWFGSAASVGAFQLLIMGQGWLVYELSGSPLHLGFLGAASSIPTIAAALVGGVVADRVDRRRMIIRRRSTRSATTPPTRAAAMVGIEEAAPRNPRCSGDPLSS